MSRSRDSLSIDVEARKSEQYEDTERSDDGSSTFLLNERDFLKHPGKILNRTRLLFFGGNLIILIISAIMLFAAVKLRWNADDVCFDLHSAYSPANSVVDHQYHMVQFNGSLGFESPYSGPPSPAVDEAWNKLTAVGIMSLSAEEVVKSGMSLDSVRFPPEVGKGQYIGSVEVNHQLHCLNFLRKATHLEYYADKVIEYTDDAATIRQHLDHCIEMLRQNLMCNADTGVITHEWVQHFPRPYPNFNTWHKCRNFDSVMDWVKSKQISQTPPNGAEEWPKVPGSVVFPNPP